MPKRADVSTLDGSLDQVALSTVQHICSAEPADFAGIAAVSLGSVAMASPGDYTKSAGSPTGRRVTTAAKSGVAISTSGTATHVVLATGSVLKLVTTCTSQGVTAGNTANVPAWSFNVAQPT